MNIVQRGNPSIMSKIRESAKAVSEANGLAKPMFGGNNVSQVRRDTLPMPNNISEMFGGTNANLISNTIKTTDQAVTIFANEPSSVVGKIDYESSMIVRVLNNLDILSDTKEYFNALQDLLALYVSGNLNKDILSHVSDEDMKEIKGILREFKAIIDMY